MGDRQVACLGWETCLLMVSWTECLCARGGRGSSALCCQGPWKTKTSPPDLNFGGAS